MSADSTIEWTDATWNPTRGCDKISPGCKNCYAETFAERWRGIPGHAYEQGFDLRLVPSAIELPLRWRKPRKIFVNSMSDLFHKDVPDEFIDQVIAVAILADRHTFQFLTKRAERMARYFAAAGLYERILRAAEPLRQRRPELCRVAISDPTRWLPPHLWMGVSVEDQQRADERIPYLLGAPAAVRFLSVEPMLGPVDLTDVEITKSGGPNGVRVALDALRGHVKGPDDMLPTKIDWVIVGGESGPGARPFALEWARSIVAQCKAAGCPVFVKQAGAMPVKALDGVVYRIHYADKKGGDPAEWPEDLRVREFPVSTQFRASEGGDGRAPAQGDAT